MRESDDLRSRLAQAEEEKLELRLELEQLAGAVQGLEADAARRAALLDLERRSRAHRLLARARRLRKRLARDGGDAQVPPGTLRIPLAGLRGALDGPVPAGEVGLRWRDELAVDDEALPALEAHPPAIAAWELEGVAGAQLHARVALRPGAWLHNRDGVRFTAVGFDAAGAELCRVERDVDPAGVPADRRWVPVTLELPAATARLELRTSLPPAANGAAAWAAWGDPVLLVPVAGYGAPASESVDATRESAEPAGAPPLISLLMPVHDPEPALLARALDSVRRQSSGNWQLCIVDDGSRDGEVRALLETGTSDERVTLVRHEQAAGISGATNAALAVARGVYVAPLDHDDELHVDAIAHVGAELARRPQLDALYTDNDKISGAGRRFSPALKPDWSPDLLRACMYTLHLGVYRRVLVEQLGGWRSELDGAQDHDLMLRIAEQSDHVGHLPEVLYHWRAHAGSAALGGEVKPQAHERGRLAVEEHLRRTGISARAEQLPIAGRYRVVHELPDGLRVAVVLPTHAAQLGDELRARTSQAAALEVVAAEQGTPWPEAARRALDRVDADAVVLLEEACLPDDPGWLAELVGLALDPGVGVAAGVVADRSGRVVHAGVAFPSDGVALPVHAGADLTAVEAPTELTMVTDRAAAGGAIALRADVLERAGGIDSDYDALALVALSLRVRELGLRVAVTPHARFTLASELARASAAPLDELRRLAADRGARSDPFYNPLLWPDSADFVVPAHLARSGLLAEVGEET